ncbi:MAG: DUF4835 family protein [Schleiferiaceae bacterium]
MIAYSKRTLLLFALSIFSFGKVATAQEMNAQVQVLYDAIQTTNTQIFQTLEADLTEFINNNIWTDERYETEERMRASFVFNITSYSNKTFSGTLQIQSSRPVYNSDYQSVTFNHLDKQVSFTYIENTRLEFVETQHLSNLTSIVAFYTYIMLGIEHETFQKGSGKTYFQKCQTIVSNAQSDGTSTGWRSFDGNKTRFWLVDNLTNPTFEPILNCLYMYHRQGLDLMYDTNTQKTAKDNIRTALISLKAVHQKRPNSFLMEIFFDTKSDEIVSIFSDGPQVETQELVSTLEIMDSGNANKYENIGK